MQAIRRALGVAQRGKDPILVDELRALVAALSETLHGHRDRALLLLGFAGASRCSELVGLTVEDLRFTRSGAVVTLRRSKSGQVGAGREVAIPKGAAPATWPVRAVQAWLRAGGIAGGPVFRHLDREGCVRPEAVSDRYVAILVMRAVAAGVGQDDGEATVPTGMDSATPSMAAGGHRHAGHSLRAGLVTSAALAGASETEIAETTGHKSLDMVRRYTRKADPFKRGVAGRVGL
jgi:integrase